MATLALLMTEAAEGQSMSPFEPNLGLTLWTWLVFGLLLYLLSKYAFPSILKLTEERERTIERQLGEAKALQAAAAANADQQKKLLDEARQKSQQMLAETRVIMEKERAAAVEQTKAEQEELLARARREIVAERERAVSDLRREAVELSLAAASRLVSQRLDGEADKKIVTDYLATIGTGK